MTSQPISGPPASALGVAQAHTVAFSGIDVKPVDVQVQISPGLPAFTVVGLPDKAVGESRERVRSALGALGIGLPTKRITINLAPADLLKEGSHFDLPIALAMLVAIGAIPADPARGYLTLGELALDGAIRAVSGVLPAALAAAGHGAITTEILPAPPFYYAEDYHQQYLAKNPHGYCGLGGTGVRCPA